MRDWGKDDENGDGDLCLDRMAAIDDDDRHEYIAHGDNGRDDAKIGNRDNDIDYPSDDDLYY